MKNFKNIFLYFRSRSRFASTSCSTAPTFDHATSTQEDQTRAGLFKFVPTPNDDSTSAGNPGQHQTSSSDLIFSTLVDLITVTSSSTSGQTLATFNTTKTNLTSGFTDSSGSNHFGVTENPHQGRD